MPNPSVTSYALSKSFHDLGLRPKESLYTWVVTADGTERLLKWEPSALPGYIHAYQTDELAELVKGLDWSLKSGGKLVNGKEDRWLVYYDTGAFSDVSICEVLGRYVLSMLKQGRLKV